MNREELFAALVVARPALGDLIYVDRAGEDYSLAISSPEAGMPAAPAGRTPESWVYWTSQWPNDDPDRQEATFKDLLEEMDSMTGAGPDRCRWDPADPYPHSH